MKNFDVLAVDSYTSLVRVLAHDLDRERSEAVINMAVRRRGAEKEFYTAVPAGTHVDGDLLRTSKRAKAAR